MCKRTYINWYNNISYFDKELTFFGVNAVSVGSVIYTKIGEVLCKEINVEKVEGFWDGFLLPFWNANKKS